MIKHVQILNEFDDDAYLIAFSPNGQFVGIVYDDFIYRIYCRDYQNNEYYYVYVVRLPKLNKEFAIRSIQWIDNETCIVAHDGNNSLYMTNLVPFKANKTFSMALIKGIESIFKLITTDSIESLAIDLSDVILGYTATFEPHHFDECYIDDIDGDHGLSTMITCPVANDKKSVIITAGANRELYAIIPK